MYQRILIATDGTPLSDKAISSGLELAALTGAQVVALKVVPRYPRAYFEGGVQLDMADVKRIEKQWADAARTNLAVAEQALGHERHRQLLLAGDLVDMLCSFTHGHDFL